MGEAIEKTVATEKQESKQEYTLRDLRDEDFYPVVAILGEVIPEDAKDALVQTFQKGQSLDIKGLMVGFDIVRTIMKNMDRKEVKSKVYDFLSDLSGVPAEELHKAPFGTTPMLLKKIFEDAKNTDFFKAVSESF